MGSAEQGGMPRLRRSGGCRCGTLSAHVNPPAAYANRGLASRGDIRRQVRGIVEGRHSRCAAPTMAGTRAVEPRAGTVPRPAPRRLGTWGRRTAGNARGFSLPELVTVLAVVAIMATLTAPWVLTSLPAFTVSRGARELQSALNQARMLAISTRQNICVQAGGGGYRFFQGGCTGAPWVGANTNSAGTFRLSNNVAVAGPSPIFTPFGTATQTGSLAVTGYGAGNSTTVTVWPSGRATIP